VSARVVHLVDDDAAVRSALGELLQLCGFDVYPFPSGEAFLAQVEALPPGAVLVDFRMTGMTGLEVQRELARRGHDLPVVFLTGHGDVPTSVRAMRGGAIDFLQKPVDEHDLMEALERGAAHLAERESARQFLLRVAVLTPREHEVIDLVAGGRRNREIAARLGITEQTVKVHRMRAMAKLEVESLPELVRRWVREPAAE
jgi:FixJ family two-component response regulator